MNTGTERPGKRPEPRLCSDGRAMRPSVPPGRCTVVGFDGEGERMKRRINTIGIRACILCSAPVAGAACASCGSTPTWLRVPNRGKVGRAGAGRWKKWISEWVRSRLASPPGKPDRSISRRVRSIDRARQIDAYPYNKRAGRRTCPDCRGSKYVVRRDYSGHDTCAACKGSGITAPV